MLDAPWRGRILRLLGAILAAGGMLLFAHADAPRAEAMARPLAKPEGPLQAGEPTQLAQEATALAARWAPVFVQRLAADHPERDRPMRVDFDGDWDATNNWAHLTPHERDQPAVVYSSAILTESHAYLTYTLFYPRDWVSVLCLPYICHDNDLEVALLVVERPSGAPFDAGRLVLVETKTHLNYIAVAGAELARSSDDQPLIEVESEGHGMHALRRGRLVDGDHTTFVHPAAGAASAADRHERRESYELVSLHDTLWARRRTDAEQNQLWTEGETGWLSYSGARYGRCGNPLGASMAGREYPGGVRPPWALRGFGQRGDWFLDPAFAALSRYGAWFARESRPSQRYVLNAYLDDLNAECRGPRCSTPAVPFVFPSALAGLSLVLGLAMLRAGLRARAAGSPDALPRRAP